MDRDYLEGFFFVFLWGWFGLAGLLFVVFGFRKTVGFLCFSSLLRRLSNGLVSSEYRLSDGKVANWDYAIISCGVFIVFR